MNICIRGTITAEYPGGYWPDFFVHLPISEMLEEGSLTPLSVELPDLTEEGGMEAEDGITEIRFWVLLALFVLILTEWGVYYYEQY